MCITPTNCGTYLPIPLFCLFIFSPEGILRWPQELGHHRQQIQGANMELKFTLTSEGSSEEREYERKNLEREKWWMRRANPSACVGSRGFLGPVVPRDVPAVLGMGPCPSLQGHGPASYITEVTQPFPPWGFIQRTLIVSPLSKTPTHPIGGRKELRRLLPSFLTHVVLYPSQGAAEFSPAQERLLLSQQKKLPY